MAHLLSIQTGCLFVEKKAHSCDTPNIISKTSFTKPSEKEFTKYFTVQKMKKGHIAQMEGQKLSIEAHK